MSTQLLIMVENFLNSRGDPTVFVDTFMREWKSERDIGIAQRDDVRLSEALSSVFALADTFNQEADRESYEFDEPGLRREIAGALERCGLRHEVRSAP